MPSDPARSASRLAAGGPRTPKPSRLRLGASRSQGPTSAGTRPHPSRSPDRQRFCCIHEQSRNGRFDHVVRCMEQKSVPCRAAPRSRRSSSESRAQVLAEAGSGSASTFGAKQLHHRGRPSQKMGSRSKGASFSGYPRTSRRPARGSASAQRARTRSPEPRRDGFRQSARGFRRPRQSARGQMR